MNRLWVALTPTFLIPVLVLVGVLLAGCSPQERLVYVQAKSPRIPSAWKTCPAEPRAPAADGTGAIGFRNYVEDVRRAVAVCRNHLGAVTNLVEGIN